MHIDIKNVRYPYDFMPDTCPICHHGIEPLMIGSNAVKRKSHEGNILQLLYRCPRQNCQRAFIATYWQSRNIRGTFENIFSLRNTAPYRGKEPVIADEIKTISADFIEIYSQAHTAEHYGLNQIAGVGYRRGNGVKSAFDP